MQRDGILGPARRTSAIVLFLFIPVNLTVLIQAVVVHTPTSCASTPMRKHRGGAEGCHMSQKGCLHKGEGGGVAGNSPVSLYNPPIYTISRALGPTRVLWFIFYILCYIYIIYIILYYIILYSILYILCDTSHMILPHMTRGLGFRWPKGRARPCADT